MLTVTVLFLFPVYWLATISFKTPAEMALDFPGHDDAMRRTVEIAEELGVPVFRHPDILPETGTHRGKGEALWKSLHVLDGDIDDFIESGIRWKRSQEKAAG